MISPNVLLTVGGVTLVTCLLTELWMFDVILKIGVRDQTSLRKRNEVRQIYLKIPFPLTFNVYFFNVTNPDEVHSGAKPVLREVGPYSYDEYIEKVDVVDNKAEDSLTYTPYSVFAFNQDKSGNLSEEDTVTILHPLIVGMVNQVLRDSPVYSKIVNKSLPEMFDKPQTIFMRAKVKDILFNGMEINCKSKDFSVSAVCMQLKLQIPDLKYKDGDEKIYLFSVLGPRNATKKQRIKVLRGISQSSDLGRVLEVDGQKETTIWGTKECNRFNGTDGWIFPPLMKPEEGLKSFSTDLCRNIKLSYVNDTILKKLKVRIYETDLGDQESDENEKCYCRSPDACLKRGLFDLSKCMGVPIIATLPHFLHTDESYLDQVEGLEPNSAKHALRVYFEPVTGSPVEAAKRMQFNFNIQPTKKISLFSNLPKSLFPLLWIEETVSLEGPLLKKLQLVFLMQTIVHDALITLGILSIVVIAVALYYRKKNTNSVHISPVYDIKKRDRGNTPVSVDGGDKKKVVMSGHEFDRY
ncbi:sensory neuron membrane protein 1-like [Rhynchophorus ferrugineus]|uniref:sensory neuron membrane protein 1-like n=1 Tax=Rhynchophorus ferrugineus TaxID=354439 RepID=UPI003FCE2FB5